MRDALGASKAAWERALAGMRTEQPTYKPALLLAILERLDAEERAGRAFADLIPADLPLSIAFDLWLRRHGAFLGPGRVHQPLRFLAVRPGNVADQLWIHRDGRLLVQPEFREALASRQGRAWLRDTIAAWLERRSVAQGRAECLALARLARGAPDDGALRETDPHLEGLGVETRQEGERLVIADGDPEFGARLLARLARGEFDMAVLTTAARRRQGQRVFAYYVLANFEGWCAFCDVGARVLLEAAHLKPVSVFPEIGLDPLNGVALCRNHHRAFDEGVLLWSGGAPQLAAAAPAGRLRGLTLPLLPASRQPIHPLRPDALEWRARMAKSGR